MELKGLWGVECAAVVAYVLVGSLYCQQPAEGDPEPGSATNGHSSKAIEEWLIACLGWVRNYVTCLSCISGSC